MSVVTFVLEIATPERLLVHEAAKSAEIPCEQGYIGVLPGHAPLLGELGIGELTYELLSGSKHSLGVHGGWVEVTGQRVRVLAYNAEHPNEIDAARAESALKRATERVGKVGGDIDIARALNALKRAQLRLKLTKSNPNQS
jgi:F-type H+-transporting ATPase subunit epsilon